MLHQLLEQIHVSIIVIFLCGIYCISFSFDKIKNSVRHWTALPGVFMGFGIFVTFLTIYDTFGHIPYKSNEIDIDTNKLIEMIGGGFLGSLIGLGLSILTTIYSKYKINEIEFKTEAKNANPYLLLQQIVENTSLNKSELVKLNIAFDTFNTKTETLNSDMIEEFSKKFEELMKKVESEAIAKSLGNLEKINADLSNNLEKIFGATGTTIAQGQTDLIKSVEGLKSLLEAKIDAINKESTDSAALAKDAVTITLEEIRKQVADMGASIAIEADAVITKKEESINKTFSTIDEKQQKAVQMQSEMVEKMQNAFNAKMSEINTATTEIQDKITEMGNNITEKADEVVNAKIESLKQTFERIEKYQRRSETVLKEATYKFGKSVTQVEYINDRRKEEFEQLEKQSTILDETIKTTKQVYDNWKETIDAIEGMETKLVSINNVIKNIDELNSKFHDYFPSTKKLNKDVQ